MRLAKPKQHSSITTPSAGGILALISPLLNPDFSAEDVAEYAKFLKEIPFLQKKQMEFQTAVASKASFHFPGPSDTLRPLRLSGDSEIMSEMCRLYDIYSDLGRGLTGICLIIERLRQLHLMGEVDRAELQCTPRYRELISSLLAESLGLDGDTPAKTFDERFERADRGNSRATVIIRTLGKMGKFALDHGENINFDIFRSYLENSGVQIEKTHQVGLPPLSADQKNKILEALRGPSKAKAVALQSMTAQRSLRASRTIRRAAIRTTCNRDRGQRD